MRILQIIQKKQYRGAEIFASQLSNHLIEQGHEVKMVSIYDGDAILPYKDEIINLSSEESHRYFDLSGWRKLKDIIQDFQPDLVQANAADTLKYAIFSKLIFKWSQPVLYRNASTSSFYIRSKFSKLLNGFLLKKVNQIISVSKASKEDLNALFPFTSTKTVVIPIGIEPMKITPIIYGSDGKNIIHVGSFTREKNHEGLINIFKQIRSKYNNCNLHLFGEGPLRLSIENLVKEANLKNRVFFYEGVMDPLPYIAGADILVLPSRIEGLPAVILEAMYSKTPVVANNVGGISEILTETTGCLVHKDDHLGFANAVINKLINPDLCQIENAFDLVKSSYINRKITNKFIEAYNDSYTGRV
jgi:L-malate glycosyltransferase